MERKVNLAAKQPFDLAIVGGGIYGVMTAYEAVKRDLKCILLEKDDFGEHTSFNWLRILHGGLRYLQTLDLKRFKESVSERSWFIRTFPEHIQLLPCLMPLYNKGIRRTDIFRLVFMINDYLSKDRNTQIRQPELKLPNGRIINASTVQSLFPMVDRAQLTGGAIWYDAWMPDSQRMLIDFLKTICQRGCLAINHFEARGLNLSENGSVVGLKGYDRFGGCYVNVKAPVVINAAGPWCREIAAEYHQDSPRLFHPSIAWNLLIDRPGLSSHALAVSPPLPRAHTYFLLAWKGRLMAGTGHRPWLGPLERNPQPSDEEMREFIDDLNHAVPGLQIKGKDILHVFGGFLPASTPGSNKLTKRPFTVDHGKEGGPNGLFSVSGVKFTTARLVAQELVARIYGNRIPASCDETEVVPINPNIHEIFRLFSNNHSPSPTLLKMLTWIASTEAAVCFEDLMTRRLGLIPALREQWPIIDKLPALTGKGTASVRFVDSIEDV